MFLLSPSRLDHVPHAQSVALFRKVVEAREDVLQGLSIAVEIEKEVEISRELITNAAISGMSGSGLTIYTGDCRDCNLYLSLLPRLEWGNASFGVQCCFALTGHLVDSRTGNVIVELDITDPRLIGVGNTRQKALQSLRQRLRDRLPAFLEEGLRIVLP